MNTLSPARRQQDLRDLLRKKALQLRPEPTAAIRPGSVRLDAIARACHTLSHRYPEARELWACRTPLELAGESFLADDLHEAALLIYDGKPADQTLNALREELWRLRP